VPDDLKRRPSKPTKRAVRHDARAEPDSTDLPEPESLITRPRRTESVPAPRVKPPLLVDTRGGRVLRPAERTTAREMAETRTAVVAPGAASNELASPPVESGGDFGALRRQFTAIHAELAQTQRKLAALQEERALENERLTDALARQGDLEASVREARDEAAEAADRRTEVDIERLNKLTDDLEKERSTSQWLRSAGEQTTRELADMRVRLTEAEATLAKEREAQTSGATKAAEAIAQAKAEQTKATEAVAQARAEHAKIAEKLTGLEAEHRKAVAALAEARASAKENDARVDEAKRAAAIEAETSIAKLRAEQEAVLSRLTETQARAAADAEEQVREMASRLSSSLEAATTLQTENESLTKLVAFANGRAEAVGKQVNATTEMLAILIRSLETLERSEEQIAKLRDQAATSRHTIADQTVALRLAFSRASDAAIPAVTKPKP
jgi:chromosome segregation ATPase